MKKSKKAVAIYAPAFTDKQKVDMPLSGLRQLKSMKEPLEKDLKKEVPQNEEGI